MSWRKRARRLIGLLGLLGIVTFVLWWQWRERAPLRRARDAYAGARWWEALASCRSYLASHPESSEALRLAAQSATQLGMFREANQYFSQTAGLLPDELRMHGDVLIKIREWDRASVVFETLVQQEPNDVTARMRLAALSLQRGRYNQAVDYARKSLALAVGTPDEPHCEYLLGSACFARGDMSEAATHYIRALALQGPGPAQLQVSAHSLRLEVVDHLLSVSRIDEAREQFALLPADEPMDTEQMYQLGRLRIYSEDNAGAQEAWEVVLQRNPDHFGALLNLGKLHLDQGRPEQAHDILLRAARIGENSASYFLLSQACSQRGDPQGSEQALKRFRELSALEEQEKQETLMIRGSPDHRDTQWILAKRARKAGDNHLAKLFLRRALMVDPDFQPARDMLAELDSNHPPRSSR